MGPTGPPLAAWGIPPGPLAHLPEEELDAAQVALDAGTVQGRLTPLVPPVPLPAWGGRT